jgi:hypothetical protein
MNSVCLGTSVALALGLVACGAHDGDGLAEGGAPGDQSTATGGAASSAAESGGSSNTSPSAAWGGTVSDGGRWNTPTAGRLNESGGAAEVGSAGAPDVTSAGAPGNIEPPIVSDTKVKAYVDGELGCHPLSEVSTQAFVPDPIVLDLPLAQSLARVKGRYEGSWVGFAEAPTGWLPERWLVSLDIEANETYMASTRSEVYVPPFYYGNTSSCPPQRIQLTTMSSEGAEGEIDIAFRYEDECALPGWQGVVKALRVDSDGVRLRFDFARSDGYGPVHYDLWRACE